MKSINQWSLQSISQLSVVTKMLIIFLVSGILVFMAYWFDFSEESLLLKNYQQKTLNLRHDFITKHPLAAQYSLYQNQYQQLQQQFNQLLRQMVNVKQSSLLLERIEKIATIDGLEIGQIKPQPPVHEEYLTILPYEIMLKGSYRQFSRLMTQLTNLEQLVTIHTFSLHNSNQYNNDQLQMDLVLYVYQYKI